MVEKLYHKKIVFLFVNNPIFSAMLFFCVENGTNLKIGVVSVKSDYIKLYANFLKVLQSVAGLRPLIRVQSSASTLILHSRKPQHSLGQVFSVLLKDQR